MFRPASVLSWVLTHMLAGSEHLQKGSPLTSILLLCPQRESPSIAICVRSLSTRDLICADYQHIAVCVRVWWLSDEPSPARLWHSIPIAQSQMQRVSSHHFLSLFISSSVSFSALWRLMVYCDIHVHFVSHNFTLNLNKLCAHRWVSAREYSTLSSSGFGVISSLKMC